MIDLAHVLLVIIVVGCIVYIYWMHTKKQNDTSTISSKSKHNHAELDNISMSDRSRDTDSVQIRELFDSEDS